jgi:hypothetical protein
VRWNATAPPHTTSWTSLPPPFTERPNPTATTRCRIAGNRTRVGRRSARPAVRTHAAALKPSNSRPTAFSDPASRSRSRPPRAPSPVPQSHEKRAAAIHGAGNRPHRPPNPSDLHGLRTLPDDDIAPAAPDLRAHRSRQRNDSPACRDSRYRACAPRTQRIPTLPTPPQSIRSHALPPTPAARHHAARFAPTLASTFTSALLTVLQSSVLSLF